MEMATTISKHVDAGPLVLICDPDVDTRGLYRESVTHAGWRVDEAEDGRDALAKALARQPALVITETRVPLLDGFTLCELLRRDSLTRQAPILVVTGDAYPLHVLRARAAGADAVLVKPCLPDRLLREMERLLVNSSELRTRATELVTRSRERALRSAQRLLELASPHPKTRVRAHERFVTTTPRVSPPDLRCPTCDRWLLYARSHVGGVNSQNAEQWDYYECPTSCGTFQYRQRTRKLRQIEMV
jgi:two-component system, cell cycle response regulator DivK